MLGFGFGTPDCAIPFEDAARIECFPDSERVADFAHFIGACVRPGQQPPDDAAIQAYRAGFPDTIKPHPNNFSRKYPMSDPEPQ